MLGIVRDITDHKLADSSLKEREVELTAIVKNIPIPLLLVDGERRIWDVNDAAVEFTGRTEEEMVGYIGGSGLGCLHSLDDPKGCGFGPHCETCEIRSAIMDTLNDGPNHHRIKASILMDEEGEAEGLDILISTTALNIMGERKVLVCIEVMDDSAECGK